KESEGEESRDHFRQVTAHARKERIELDRTLTNPCCRRAPRTYPLARLARGPFERAPKASRAKSWVLEEQHAWHPQSDRSEHAQHRKENAARFGAALLKLRAVYQDRSVLGERLVDVGQNAKKHRAEPPNAEDARDVDVKSARGRQHDRAQH